MTRGCGRRVHGGLYACCSLSPFGQPVEEFLIDPPFPYHYSSFRSPIIVEIDGVNHIILWVGADYPYVTDFIEETKRFGISKRIPKTFPIEKLTKKSILVLVHPKAIIVDYTKIPAPQHCPKGEERHYAKEEYCLGQVYWIVKPNANGMRKIGDTVYAVSPCEAAESELIFKAGIFGRFPITNFDYVTKDGSVDPCISEKASSTALPINFVDE